MNRSHNFYGYIRPDGSVGVRNHVALVATVYCSSHVVEEAARQTKAIPIVHQWGCEQIGKDAMRTTRALNGIVRNPNVGAAVFVGLGCEQNSSQELMLRCVKPSTYVDIQEAGGTGAAIEQAVQQVRELQGLVAKDERVSVPLSKLVMGTICASSDATSGIASNPALGVVADLILDQGGAVILGEPSSFYGAAHELIRRLANPDDAATIINLVKQVHEYSIKLGQPLESANPTVGNIKGGLTTMVEKALGAIQKGGTSRIEGVLEWGERTPGPGLWLMDTGFSAVDPIAASAEVCGGAQIVCMTTGRGTPTGNAVAPVIKITANANTAKIMGDNIDVDLSGILAGQMDLKAAGELILDTIIAIAEGAESKAEKWGHREFGIAPVVG